MTRNVSICFRFDNDSWFWFVHWFDSLWFCVNSRL